MKLLHRYAIQVQKSPQTLIDVKQQAFEGLKNAGRKVRRPDCTLATTDHVCSNGSIYIYKC
jgi:homoaconitase/3-isopropylmalate dehydratase large subunit